MAVRTALAERLVRWGLRLEPHRFEWAIYQTLYEAFWDRESGWPKANNLAALSKRVRVALLLPNDNDPPHVGSD